MFLAVAKILTAYIFHTVLSEINPEQLHSCSGFICQIIMGILANWLVLVVGVLNIVSAIKDMNYSKTIVDNPVGIVRNFERLMSPIIVLVYNFFIGGVIGVIGSLYYFIALRGFVMEQKEAFLEIEYNHLS